MSANWNETALQEADAFGYHIIKKPFTVNQINNWLDECEKDIEVNRKLIDIP
jgi:hypothetical protein